MRKLTVAEYQKIENVSKKTIYKRINQGKLNTTQELVNNKLITFIVLEEQGLTPDLPPSPAGNLPPSPEEKEQGQGKQENFSNDLRGQGLTPDLPPSPAGNSPPSPADTTIEFLKEQLREKDRQLAERDKQINLLLEQVKQAQNLLDQEQKLHAGTRILVNAPTEEEKPAPKKQRSRLYKFFFNE